ncbi:5E5 antigen-like isoform X1 [Anguilla anguilla]|uniref:5E5 antigen-like isoform X1 n=1 Tax=Anguilla anguilla TaxID=7936 RepID=UPI0015B23854|nr:5E5 antigen-like isoform X1 [Anguilla anguilla]
MKCFQCGSYGHVRRACPQREAAGTREQEARQGGEEQAGPEPEPGPSTAGTGERTGNDPQGAEAQQGTVGQGEREASGTGDRERGDVTGPGAEVPLETPVSEPSGAPLFNEQSSVRVESGEAGGGPVGGLDPPVEVAAAPEEGEWSREGTEADPDEEDDFSESSQTDEVGSALRALLGSPNGKKCFTCVDNDCSTLECKKSEDRCFKATAFTEGKKLTVKGCAPQFLCSTSMHSVIEKMFPEFYGLVMSCCEGNLCNNALRIGQSVLFLLLVPVASVILFN